MGKFSAQVKAWAKETEAKKAAVFKIATQKLVDAMILTIPKQGNLPVDTGNLRRSLMASTSVRPTIISGKEDFTDGFSEVEFVISGATIKDKIYIGFQAEYARRMEYGFIGQDALGRVYNQAGFAFVGQAALDWQRFVDEAVREVK